MATELKAREGIVTVGPFGGMGGTYFDDGTEFDRIKGITIITDNVHVCCMGVVYEKNGTSYPINHGASRQGVQFEFTLYSGEHITGLKGTYGAYRDGQVVTSLTFIINNYSRKCGPYGCESGTPFDIPVQGGHVVSFIGRSGWLLDAVGCHLTSA